MLAKDTRSMVHRRLSDKLKCSLNKSLKVKNVEISIKKSKGVDVNSPPHRIPEISPNVRGGGVFLERSLA